jgi:hypothetical protein
MFFAFAIEKWAYGGTANYFVHAVPRQIASRPAPRPFARFSVKRRILGILAFCTFPLNQEMKSACLLALLLSAVS